jgi:hypothetical protein
MTKQRIFVQPNEGGPLDRNFEKLVKESLKVWHVPGVSVAVVDGDNTWTKVHPKWDFRLAILTTLLGLWYLLVSFHTRDTINAFLHREYDKSIHGSYHILSCRRQ